MAQKTKTGEELPVVAAFSPEIERELLRKLVRRGVLDIRPTWDRNGLRYAGVEEAWADSDIARVREQLAGLEKAGVLRSRVLERILFCPGCGSPEIHSKFTCPRCSAYEVELTELLEHSKCGYIGPRREFSQEEGLVCPSCHFALGEEPRHYRVIGNFFQCDKCGYRFDKPEVMHSCLKCGAVSNYQEVKYARVLGYKVAEEILKEFARDLPILDNIEKALADKGFKVKVHAKVSGVSGVESVFDLFAEKARLRLAFDLSLDGSKTDIVALLAKKVDVNPNVAAILDLSGGDELALLGKVYGIVVFKVAAGEALPEGFGSFVDSLLPKEA